MTISWSLRQSRGHTQVVRQTLLSSLTLMSSVTDHMSFAPGILNFHLSWEHFWPFHISMTPSPWPYFSSAYSRTQTSKQTKNCPEVNSHLKCHLLCGAFPDCIFGSCSIFLTARSCKMYFLLHPPRY